MVQRHRPILLRPHLLSLTLERRRKHAIDLPQPPFRLINMELPVVSSVSDMRLQNCIDAIRRSLVDLVFVWKCHGDVLDCDSNKRLLFVCLLAAHPDGVARHLDEVDDDIERGEANSRVELGNVG